MLKIHIKNFLKKFEIGVFWEVVKNRRIFTKCF